MRIGKNSPPLLPDIFRNWFRSKGWQPHPHQLEVLAAVSAKQSVLLVAPTGGGKTLSGFLPSLIDLAETKQATLHTLYISPLKSLTTDIARNLMTPITEMGLDIRVETRTGDTPSNRRKRQFIKPPHILLTTPESLELILSYEEAYGLLRNVKRIIIDEIHALAPGKRGHLTSLVIAQIAAWNQGIRITGLSATVAEPEKLAAWLSMQHEEKSNPKMQAALIHAPVTEKPRIRLLEMEKRIPWSGYMATYAVPEIYQAVLGANSSIIFVNTRAQAELLFQHLWQHNSENIPIALHHGSLTVEHRKQVEAMMANGAIRAIVATASLDLGLDWGTVDLVIQVGAPKGISRLLQRIGRSNHQFDKPSQALLVPTNRFEVLECQAVMDAISAGEMDGEPLLDGGLDVLAQFIMNMACSGFDIDTLYHTVRRAWPYRNLTLPVWQQLIALVSHGGYALKGYERYHRITNRQEDGKWVAVSPQIIHRHRMNIGTIVEYQTLRIKMRRKSSAYGRDLGKIEEYFVQGLAPGDSFIFAGQLVSFERIHDNVVEVSRAKGGDPKIPSFLGGKLPLSLSLANRVKALMTDEAQWQQLPPQVTEWLKAQKARAILPAHTMLLVETFPHQRRHYLMVYSFAGRNANQTLGLLISRYMEKYHLLPLGFAANDYVLCLWAAKALENPSVLLDYHTIKEEGGEWLSESAMAKRAFREVAIIAGLVERHFPGSSKTGRQVTFSTDLLYDVLLRYEPDHLLLKAAYQQARNQLADMDRLEAVLTTNRPFVNRLGKISPLAIPLLVEIGIERIGGEAETYLLRQQEREKLGDRLLAGGGKIIAESAKET